MGPRNAFSILCYAKPRVSAGVVTRGRTTIHRNTHSQTGGEGGGGRVRHGSPRLALPIQQGVGTRLSFDPKPNLSTKRFAENPNVQPGRKMGTRTRVIIEKGFDGSLDGWVIEWLA